MENNENNSIQLIDGRMVDISKLSAKEAAELLAKVEEDIKAVEAELKKRLLESEATKDE